MTAHPIVLSERDAMTLRELLERLLGACLPDQFQIELLQEKIDNAEVLPSHSIPPEVVRIGSTVRALDLRTGRKKKYAIVSPELSDMAKRLLSVTAPLGLALLGRRKGDLIEAKVPNGLRLLKIETVHQSASPAGSQMSHFRERVTPLVSHT